MSEIKISGDYLDRGRYARSLYRIIGEYTTDGRLEHANTDNKAFVLAVSGKWGTGKSYFIERFEKILWLDTETLDPSSVKHFPTEYAFKKPDVFHYDAWENDFCDNAFIPLYDKIMQGNFGLYKREEFKKDKVFKILKMVGVDAVRVISEFIGKTGKALVDTMPEVTPEQKTVAALTEGTAETLEDVLKDIPDNVNRYWKELTKKYEPAEEPFPEYIKFRKAIELLKIVLAYAVDKTESKKIAIVIDELDRCKPTFAVQTLEVVKHLFNVPGIVFIFSLDITELQHCVKNVYGKDFNAVGYLERFFDYTSLLPPGNMERLFKKTLKDFKCIPVEGEDDRSDVYYQICKKFHLSVREIRAVCASFHYLERFELEGYPRHAKQLYFYLLVMKYKEPVKVIDAISDSKAGIDAREYLMDNYPPVFKPDGNNYTKFTEVFKANEVIGVSKYNPIDKDGGNTDIRTPKFTETDYPKDEGSFSYALYAPDHDHYEEIKDFRLLEYLFRKVELYDTAIKEESQRNTASANESRTVQD